MSPLKLSHSLLRLVASPAVAAFQAVRDSPLQLVALLVAGAAAWPLLSEPGLLNTIRGGGDSPFLLQRLHQLESALSDGHFPVRWMPDANYGYGFPFFNYYAPLSIYVAFLFRLIGFSFVRAIQLAQLAAFVTAALAMFRLGRRWLGDDRTGLLASIAYTLAPFHMVNVYVRGDSLAEFWAMAFYPLVILSADDLVTGRGGNRTVGERIALLALSFGGLILTHNISALIFTPFVLLYITLAWWFASRNRPLLKRDTCDERENSAPSYGTGLLPALLALGLGLAVAAFFFVPALAEKSLAQLGPALEGHFYYGNHFRGFDLIQSGFQFSYDPGDGSAFRMGLVQALFAFAGVLILVIRKGSLGGQSHRNRQARRRSSHGFLRLLFILSALFVATLMITPLSEPLWETVPLLAFTQFPWRFLSVQAVATALATAALACLPGKRLVVLGVTVIFLVSALGKLEKAHLYLSDDDITGEKLAQYEWFTGNIGTTVSAEYLPSTVQPRAYTSLWITDQDRDHVQPLAGKLLSAQVLSRQATRQLWRVSTAPQGEGTLSTLSFPTMHWPGWRATVDGRPVEVRPAPGSGLLTLDVAPGEHEIALRLGRTPVRLAAEVASLAGVLLAGWLLLRRRAIKPSRFHAGLLIWLLLLAIMVRLWPERVLDPGDLNWDFGQMGYLHHASDGVLFDNGAHLVGYRLSEETVDAGGSLDVTLNWRWSGQASPPQATLALALPSVNRFEDAPLLVSQSLPLQSGEVSFHLPIPDNAPGGLYVPRLTFDEARALMSPDRTRGDLFLRPVRISAKQSLRGEDGPPFAVQAVRVAQRDGTTLDLQLAWLAQQPLNQNYNVTLRLVDATGLQLAQFDTQPGYGFLPSTGWPTGRWVNDWLALTIPEQLSGNTPYTLLAQLYEVGSNLTVLTRSLGELTGDSAGLSYRRTEPQFTLPEAYTPARAEFEEGSNRVIRLHGFNLVQRPDELELTLYWEAVVAGRADYTRFVHLTMADGDMVPVVQGDSMPRNNLYPTGQWVAGEVVADPVVLNLADVAPGDYQLVVGVYRNLGSEFPRLTAWHEDGTPFAFDRVPLPVAITISGN